MSNREVGLSLHTLETVVSATATDGHPRTVEYSMSLPCGRNLFVGLSKSTRTLRLRFVRRTYILYRRGYKDICTSNVFGDSSSPVGMELMFSSEGRFFYVGTIFPYTQQ